MPTLTRSALQVGLKIQLKSGSPAFVVGALDNNKEQFEFYWYTDFEGGTIHRKMWSMNACAMFWVAER